MPVGGAESELCNVDNQASLVSQLVFPRAVASQYLQVGKCEAAAVCKRAKEDWLAGQANEIADDGNLGGGSTLPRDARPGGRAWRGVSDFTDEATMLWEHLLAEEFAGRGRNFRRTFFYCGAQRPSSSCQKTAL